MLPTFAPVFFLSLDIEGAFNTLSWEFISAALDKYNFPAESIRWFHLMNEGTYARILYNGHLSNKVKLLRSCRQGDPVSPYIFLLAIECLASLVRQNKNIRGIAIGDVENKVSCYADDTLFFLDGSVNSCRCLFHDLGVFAKFSGLRPNITKTEAMWVGYDVQNKAKICEELPIKWTKQIKVLGIIYENDIQKMTENNFERKKGEIHATIKDWQKRYLTIYGKICVIKSLIIPKLTHLFAALPNPSPDFLKELNTILFNFVWNGKRDKISRKSLVQPIEYGGAGMIDVNLYLKSLKIAWVRRMLQSDSQWIQLFESKIGQKNCIWDRNAVSLRNFSRRVSYSRFWCEVMEAVADLKDAYGDYSLDEMAASTLWYSDLSKFCTSRINEWYSKGIHYLNDLLNADGNIMSFEEMKIQYGIEGVQFDYDCLVNSLPRTWKAANKTKLMGPLIDPCLSFIVSKSLGSKHIYWKLMQKQIKSHAHKWECKWSAMFREVAWSEVYTNNKLASIFMRYRSAQYKIITRTCATQRLLHRIGVVESINCKRCYEVEDSIEHKFWFCPVVQIFWESIKNWMLTNRIMQGGSEFNAKTVLLGLGKTSLFNHVVIVGKMVIGNRERLNLDEVIRWLRADRELERMIAVCEGDRKHFEDKWERANEALISE